MKKTWFCLLATVAVIGVLVLSACQPKTVIVEKEVEKVVTQVVNVEKEVTKIVAGTPVVEKVVETQVVEVVVTATPAPPTPVPEPVTLRWANYAEGADIKTMERQIKAFQNEYPWVEIQMEIAPWREYWTQLLAQIAAGTGPDVFAQSGWYIPNFHDQGLMLNLTPFVKEAQETWLVDEKYFTEALGAGNYMGNMYTLTEGVGANALFYNKDMFDAAGLSYPSDDWTWDDLLEASTKLTIDTNGKHPDEEGFDTENIVQWGVWYRPYTTTADVYSSIYRNGGQILDENFNCTVNQPEAVEAIQFFYDLYAVHHVAPGMEDCDTSCDPLAGGLVAMMSTGTWKLKQYLDMPELNYGIAMKPQSPGEPRQWGEFWGGGYAISATTPQPDAAWLFLSYLVKDEKNQTALAARGNIPVNREIAELFLVPPPDGVDALLRELNYPMMPCFQTIPHQGELFQGLQDYFDQIWLGEKPVQEALDEACVLIDGLMADAK